MLYLSSNWGSPFPGIVCKARGPPDQIVGHSYIYTSNRKNWPTGIHLIVSNSSFFVSFLCNLFLKITQQMVLGLTVACNHSFWIHCTVASGGGHACVETIKLLRLTWSSASFYYWCGYLLLTGIHSQFWNSCLVENYISLGCLLLGPITHPRRL